MNLVDLIKGQIGGDTLSRLGSTLGTSTEETRTAVDAAIPSVLAGLTHVASTPDGAHRLDAAIDGFDERAATDSAANGGNGVLGSLMGGGMLSSLTSALGKHLGIPGVSTSSLLAMIGPIILGLLKRQKNALGLDAGGVANLLSQQKSNIASAMPSGLGSALSSVPGIGGLFGGARAAASQVGHQVEQGYNATTDAARRAVSAVTPRPSVLPWALGALALLALGLILWKAMQTTTPTVSQVPAPTPAPAMTPQSVTDAIPAAAQMSADSVTNVSTKLTDSLKSATDTFTSITDAASADTAAPKLRDFSTQLDSVKALEGKLAPQDKSQITTMMKPMLDKLNPLMDKALAVPGVNDRIGPLVKEIRDKLDSIQSAAS